MRAPSDLWRRRTHLMRQRAERLAPVQNTNRQYNLPESGKKLADQAHRDGVAERCTAPAGKASEIDLALITYDDERLQDLELAILKTAKHHEAHPLSLLQTGPGIGKILSLALRYAIHDMDRFPTGQACVSYGRLGTRAQESAGTCVGTAGKTMGSAHLTWACSEAAALFLRNKPAGPNYLARLENTHDKGAALTLLAHKLARRLRPAQAPNGL